MLTLPNLMKMKKISCVMQLVSYVPFKLLKKYEKGLDAEFAASVSECLLSMSVNGDESDLMEYTRSWTLLVNRGGLFEVNDLTYTPFK